MDLDFLMRFCDFLAAEEKGTFTADGGFWASLLQGDQPCLVPEPAPTEAGQFSPQPPSCGGILLALCWSPRSSAVASDCEVPSQCLSTLSHPVGHCQAPPWSVLPWPLIFWVSCVEFRELHLRALCLSLCSCCYAVALHAGLCPGLRRQGAKALCFHPVLPCLLRVVLQAPKGRAVSHKGHILLPGPAPAMSPPLKQTAECREDRMAWW